VQVSIGLDPVPQQAVSLQPSEGMGHLREHQLRHEQQAMGIHDQRCFQPVPWVTPAAFLEIVQGLLVKPAVPSLRGCLSNSWWDSGMSWGCREAISRDWVRPGSMSYPGRRCPRGLVADRWGGLSGAVVCKLRRVSR
jgi:hypothetical protein